MKECDEHLVKFIEKDTRYATMLPHILKEMRNRVYADKSSTKYDRACIQYWLLKREGRLDDVFVLPK